MERTYGTFGRQVIADFWGVDPNIIDNLEYMKVSCESAAKKSGATILNTYVHKFYPEWVTVTVRVTFSTTL